MKLLTADCDLLGIPVQTVALIWVCLLSVCCSYFSTENRPALFITFYIILYHWSLIPFCARLLPKSETKLHKPKLKWRQDS